MQISPPTKATMISMSMDRQSSWMWVGDSTGQVSSDQAIRQVCPTESSTTGYFLYLMLR